MVVGIIGAIVAVVTLLIAVLTIAVKGGARVAALETTQRHHGEMLAEVRADLKKLVAWRAPVGRLRPIDSAEGDG